MIPLTAVRLDTRLRLGALPEPASPDPVWTPLDDGLEGLVAADPSRATLVWDTSFRDEALSPLSLFEQREYVCALPPGAEISAPFSALFTPLSSPAGAAGLWLLSTRNRIGSALFEASLGPRTLFSLPIELRARKLDHLGDVRAMLDALSLASLSAVLSTREAPTEVPLRLDARPTRTTAPLDRYFTLRALARSRVLDDALDAIAARPISALESSRRVVPLAQATRVRTEDLASAHGPPGPLGLPARVTDARPVSTLDTPENRFINTVFDRLLDEARDLAAHPDTARVAVAARALGEHFEALAARLPFRDIGPLASHAPVHSAALQRRDGYRELLSLWIGLDTLTARPDQRPFVATDALRDVATLYERWCGLTLARALDLPETLVPRLFGLQPKVLWNFAGAEIELAAQRTYSRMAGSYSLPLRPDYTLTVRGRRLVIDAKYQLQSAFEPFGDGEPELSAWASSGVVKMHAYRDAIEGVWGAYALFPGREPVGQCFEAPSGGGTGALPLSPGGTKETQDAQRAALRQLVERFVTECDRTVA